MKHSSKSS